MGGDCYLVDVHHGDEAENQERQKKISPFLAHQMSNWFYDTSTGTATRAARCGSLFGKTFISWLLTRDGHGEHNGLRG
jgi:hypothetical protein